VSVRGFGFIYKILHPIEELTSMTDYLSSLWLVRQYLGGVRIVFTSLLQFLFSSLLSSMTTHHHFDLQTVGGVCNIPFIAAVSLLITAAVHLHLHHSRTPNQTLQSNQIKSRQTSYSVCHMSLFMKSGQLHTWFSSNLHFLQNKWMNAKLLRLISMTINYSWLA